MTIGTDIAAEFYSRAPLYRTKMQLAKTIDRAIEKINAEKEEEIFKLADKIIKLARL